MDYETTFKSIFGDTLPNGKKAFVLPLDNDSNPIKITSKYTGTEGGTAVVKNGMLYVQSNEFNHVNAKELWI